MYEINERIVKCDNGETTTYGVTYDGGEISDICVDKGRIEEFIELINRLEVSTIHIDEVVEDFLCN